MDMFSNLTIFDWATAVAISLLAVGGFVRGFTHEALSLAGWVLAAVMVRMFHEGTTLWLQPRIGNAALAAGMAFVLLFFGTAIVIRLVASLAGIIAKGSPAGPVDRILGFGFGGLKGVLVMAAVFVLAQFATGLFDSNRRAPAWLQDSRSAPVLALAADTMVGWIREFREGSNRSASIPPQSRPQLQLPPGHPGFGPQFLPPRDEGGYSREDRDALDRLLNEGAKKGEQVEI
jgi:membrane protein required for colicin V production